MDPKPKNPQIEAFLKELVGFDRREAIRNNRCVPPPIGCGKPVEPEGWEDLVKEEYRLSGLCRECQTAFFDLTAPEDGGETDDDETA